MPWSGPAGRAPTGWSTGEISPTPATINADNIGDLRLRWIFQTGVLGSFENTPVVEDGVMYVTTPYNHVFAIDAHSGREL
jgi:alcohol dehydrogenase (cytochrome c)